ncbi:MAG: hypothetical protein ACT4R6_14275 [Gemmatimonadaceae bacterium]
MKTVSKLTGALGMVVLSALVLLGRPNQSWADSPICKPTGCPTGEQLCAKISTGVPGVGSVEFYCYQPLPSSGKETDE